VWLNGEPIAAAEASRGFTGLPLTVALEPGPNEVLIKATNGWNENWGAYALSLGLFGAEGLRLDDFSSLPAAPEYARCSDAVARKLEDGGIELEPAYLKRTDLKNATCGPQSMPAPWSGGAQLWFQPEGPGGEVTILIDVDTETPFRTLELTLTSCHNYGIVSFAVVGKPRGSPFDGYNGEGGTPGTHCVRRHHTIEGLELGRGTHRLTLTCTGKRKESAGFMAGIDTIVLRP
jgi:hypothetical protein